MRLLSIKPMTETQLSRKLGLTKAAVGYHLHLLAEANMVHIEKVEAEKHGILQKYYSPAAAIFIVDPRKIPSDIKTYFIQNQIQLLRGFLLALKTTNNIFKFSSEDIEKLAIALLDCLKRVGEKYVKEDVVGEDAETIRMRIYAEALARLMRRKEWKRIFGKTSYS